MVASNPLPGASYPWLNASNSYSRSNTIFSWYAYARIVARKHNMPAPEPQDWDNLSDEEILVMVTVLRDLAHVPSA